MLATKYLPALKNILNIATLCAGFLQINTVFATQKNYLEYEVKKHDTLSKILRNHRLQPIYGEKGFLNKTLILNPQKKATKGDLIFQGEVILIPTSLKKTDLVSHKPQNTEKELAQEKTTTKPQNTEKKLVFETLTKKKETTNLLETKFTSQQGILFQKTPLKTFETKEIETLEKNKENNTQENYFQNNMFFLSDSFFCETQNFCNKWSFSWEVSTKCCKPYAFQISTANQNP
jgi:hypothetical protein